MMTRLDLTSAPRNGGVSKDMVLKAVGGLLAAVTMLLVGLAFTASAENRQVNHDQDLKLLYLHIADSINTARLVRIEAKVDSVWANTRSISRQRRPD